MGVAPAADVAARNPPIGGERDAAHDQRARMAFCPRVGLEARCVDSARTLPLCYFDARLGWISSAHTRGAILWIIPGLPPGERC